jgi:MFS superfamily sulfate permease-like transporter
MLIHLINGVPLRSLFKSHLDVEMQANDVAFVRARYSAIFSNWILFRRQLVQLGLIERKNVVLDLSQCKLVDHSVMEKLHELECDFHDANVWLRIRGLEGHKQLSEHEFAARKRAMTRLRRVTVVAGEDLEKDLASKFAEFGASGYTSIPCTGAGRSTITNNNGSRNAQVRLEAVVPPDVAERILDYLHVDVSPANRITACVESVEVLQQNKF